MLYICNQPDNIFEIATKGPKENLPTYQRKSRYEIKPVLIKLLTLFNYWFNQMEKPIAAVKGTVMQIEKSPINYHLRVSKVS